ncbi:ferritin family protein [Candidatus Aerophobetes bacterium]|nr:ferritin family protein [Candidatus Aerophobetes bacterium]
MANIFSASEVVQLGIQIEKNGKDFYSRVSTISKSDTAKKIFQYLADEEEKHIKVWEDILSEVGEKYEPPEVYSDEYFSYLRALSEEYVFTKEKKGEELAKEVKDEMEAIEIGIDAEKDAILFYSEMKKLVLKGAHETIDKLIHEEQKHLSQLSQLKKH